MARQAVQFLAFNRGVVSKYALGRVDLKRMQYSAEQQENWMPRVFGPMMLRPGWGYLGFSTLNNAKAVPIPFIRSTNDAQFLEATDSILRPTSGNQLIVRPDVGTTVTNGNFAGSLAGWTTVDQTGAQSVYDGTLHLKMTGTGANDAITYQAVYVAPADQGTEHALRIVVSRGPVMLRIGTASYGNDDIQQETALDTGTHSIAFTPTVSVFYIYFFNRLNRAVGVTSCNVEGAGTLTLPASWTVNDLPNLRWDQSADVLYFTDGVHKPGKIERRAPHSWSITDYVVNDGPYLPINFTPTTITPSAASGDITLTANSPVFEPGHVGALFRLASAGQQAFGTLAGLNQSTAPAIRVTGVGKARDLYWVITGAYSGQIRLQVSADPNGGFSNLGVTQGGANGPYNDGQDNAILYYRLTMTAYTSGAPVCEMNYGGGSINGDVRITGYTSSTLVSGAVIGYLGGTTGTNTWYEGAWSTFRGFPSSLCLFEDRLWWFGLGTFWGSVVDAYESFDDTTVGDAGPISRTIGKGPVDWVNWGIALLRLLVATDGTVISARSDSLDTPLTPTNFNLKFPVTQGAARIAAVNADDRGYFVHRNRVRVYELAFDVSNYIKLDYGATDLTDLAPDVCQPGIVKIVVQRQPDTRVHCILSDGTVALMVRDHVENIVAWVKLTCNSGNFNLGFVEDAVVLPSSSYEDTVIYVVRRSVNGQWVRYYEKHALESECVGGTLNKQADAFVIYSGPPTNVIGGLGHLVGQYVVVWADGRDLSPGGTPGNQVQYLVNNSGQITLQPGVTVSNAVIGLPYTAIFKGTKLAYAAQQGSALTMRKRVAQIGLILADTHSQGILFGGDTGNLDSLPNMESGAAISYDTVWSQYDKDFHPFDGDWDTDSRVFLVAYAPRPVRALAMVLDVETEEG